MKISRLLVRVAIACGLSAVSLVATQVVLPAGPLDTMAHAAISVCAWNDLDWDEMSADQQQSWAALGWDEDRWYGDAPAPTSDNKDWYELSPKEKAAAARLGYAWRTWDVDTCPVSADDIEPFVYTGCEDCADD